MGSRWEKLVTLRGGSSSWPCRDNHSPPPRLRPCPPFWETDAAGRAWQGLVSHKSSLPAVRTNLAKEFMYVCTPYGPRGRGGGFPRHLTSLWQSSRHSRMRLESMNLTSDENAAMSH